MHKLIRASLIMFLLITLHTKAFASTLDCKFKDVVVTGIKTIQLTDESLFINKDMEIPLEKSRVNCGSFGRQTRFDGNALGYQIILKSCSTEAKLEGHLIDSVNKIAADVFCQSSVKQGK